MRCPKCHNEVANNILRCNICGVKIKMLCPSCQSINRFGDKICKSCGAELIKYCKKCNAANLPKASVCRKCGAELDANKNVSLHDYRLQNKVDASSPQEVQKTNVVVEKLDQKSLQEQMADEDIKSVHESVISAGTEDKVVLDVVEQADTEIMKVEDFLSEEPVKEVMDKSYQPETTEPEEKLNETEVIEIEENSEVQINTVDDIISVAEEAPNRKNVETETIQLSQDDENTIEFKYYSQIQSKQQIVKIIKNVPHKQVIALSGDEGCGKSIVLSSIAEDLSKDNVVSLLGECTPLTQISPFGFFQDVFLRLLALPAFCTNIESFNKANRKVFENVFSLLSPLDVTEFINLLYPYRGDKFENILDNKDKTFDLLEKVLNSIALKNKFIIIVDNFDLIDGISYEFLLHLLNKGYFAENARLIIAYKDKRIAQSYFFSNSIDEKAYENIAIQSLSDEELSEFIDNYIPECTKYFPDDVRETIISKSYGNVNYLEQVVAYFKDIDYIYSDKDKCILNSDKKPPQIPYTITEALHLRLNNPEVLPPLIKNILFSASIMGYKFDVNLLANSLSIPDEQLVEALTLLQKLSYLTPVNQYSCVFKSLSLWRYIYEEAKTDELYIENNRKLYKGIEPFVLSNNSLKAVILKNLVNVEQVLEAWKANSELSLYLGDINLYIISLKQCIKLLSENEGQDYEELYNDICEKIGKLSHKSNPQDSIEYLSTVISTAKKAENTVKIVELCAYLVNSCYSVGNFYGVIEAVNLVLSSMGENFDEFINALVKSRKLKALFYVGNCEEVVNIALNEIIPVLEDNLSKQQNDPNLMKIAYESWVETNLVMANAYSVQGNEKGFEVIDNVIEIMKLNKLESDYYLSKADISRAFAYTVVGKIKKSFEVLDIVANTYKKDLLNKELLSQWNLIYVINKVLTNQAANIKEELFSLATFANNTNDNFSKNIIKIILGYIIQKDGNLAKSLEIYNEQITYFASEKIAIGALLCWYLIAQVSLTIEGADRALDIATKALEVAQNPKINNYNFMVYFQKFIAEIYMIKGDLDATKMYLEKALLITKQFGLKYARVEIYKSFAKYVEEFISTKAEVQKKEENAKIAIKMYNKALSLANELEIESLVVSVNQDKASFKTYCQLNEIQL